MSWIVLHFIKNNKKIVLIYINSIICSNTFYLLSFIKFIEESILLQEK